MSNSSVQKNHGPHWTHGKSPEEDRGYRRGFDQGVAALAYLLGIDNEKLQQTIWKTRVRDFRHYRIMQAPTEPTKAEITELRRLLP